MKTLDKTQKGKPKSCGLLELQKKTKIDKTTSTEFNYTT